VLLARHVLALLIAALLIGLPTVAFGDPADPTWIGGYWDDDDFDDAVIAITELPLWVPIALVEMPRHDAYGAPRRPASSPRTPPVDSPTYH